MEFKSETLFATDFYKNLIAKYGDELQGARDAHKIDPQYSALQIVFADAGDNYRIFRSSAATKNLNMLSLFSPERAISLPESGTDEEVVAAFSGWMEKIGDGLREKTGVLDALKALSMLDSAIVSTELWFKTTELLSSEDSELPSSFVPAALRVTRMEVVEEQDPNIDLSAPFLEPDVINKDRQLFAEGLFYDDWDLYPAAGLRNRIPEHELLRMDQQITDGVIQVVYVSDNSDIVRIIDNVPNIPSLPDDGSPKPNYDELLRLLQLAGGRVMLPSGFISMYKNPIRCGILRAMMNWHATLIDRNKAPLTPAERQAMRAEVGLAVARIWPGARGIRFWYATPEVLTEEGSDAPALAMPYGYTVIRDTPATLS